MKSLYSELNNRLFINLCHILSLPARPERKEFRRLLREGYNYDAAADWDLETTIEKMYFKDHSAEMSLPEKLEIPDYISPGEIAWLTALLQDPEFSPLLSDDLRGRLEWIVKTYGGNAWEDGNMSTVPAGRSLPDSLRQPLLTLLSALREGKKIHFHLKGKEISASPYRLEYDMADHVYRLIYMEDGYTIPKRAWLADLENMTLSGEPAEKGLQEMADAWLSGHEAQVTLLLKDDRNALERCFALFSSYEKEAYRTSDDTYHLVITYYTFDEEEVMNKILSLLDCARVMDPKPFWEKIIARLEGAWSRMAASLQEKEPE